MAYLDRADLIRRLKIKLRRPPTDTALTVSTADDVCDDALTAAQDSLTKLLGVYVPDALWTVPTLLTSSDGGYTYSFGLDTDNAAIFAFGKYVIYPDQASIPDNPLVPNVDYLVEGAKIRMPNNAPQTFAAGPYAQYVAPSNVIKSGTEPTVPVFARMALLAQACAFAAKVLEMDPSEFEEESQDRWIEVLTAIRTQANGKNRPIAIGRSSRTSRWAYRRGW